jgi:hypothetical protein
MSIITSQKISRLYELYRNITVTFTKEVISTIGLNISQTYVKCLGDNWPCVIYASSMSDAKIVLKLSKDAFEKIRQANNLVSLRFSFTVPDKNEPLTFFISSKIAGFNPYSKNNPELNIISLNFTQRPPDDLIEILGRLQEANAASRNRSSERIEITVDSIRRLHMVSKDAALFIQNVPRKCIMRDISFSGAKIIILGVGKFLVNKPFILVIPFDDLPKPVYLKGTVVRFEEVEGRRDITSLALSFTEDQVPMEYKMRLTEYLNQGRPGVPSATEKA